MCPRVMTNGKVFTWLSIEGKVLLPISSLWEQYLHYVSNRKSDPYLSPQMFNGHVVTLKLRLSQIHL